MDSTQKLSKFTIGPTKKKITFDIPPWFDDDTRELLKTTPDMSVKAIVDHKPDLPNHRATAYWWVAINCARIQYEELIENEGWTHEQASVVLPPHTEG